MREIIIEAGGVTIRAVLLDTPTAQRVFEALPIRARAKTWGEEIYFDIPVSCARESEAREVVEAGEIAYWPDGKAIAIGFGPTPVSQGDEIRLVSPVNIWAKALDDVRQFIAVGDGDAVQILKA